MSNLKPYAYKDKEKEFLNYWKNNTDKTLYVGFECTKDIYSFLPGNCTDFTGFGGSGKTEYALEIMFYLSEQHNIRHALYVPDIGNYNEIRRKLIHKHTGKSLNKHHPNYITEHELIHANLWVDNHFIILHKIDPKKPVTPFDFWEFVASYKDNNGPIQTGLIDAWKNLQKAGAEDDSFNREDLFNDYALCFRNELAEESDKHFFTIAHSGKTDIDKKTGRRRIPDGNDIKGGGWHVNGKCIVTVDYPDKKGNKTDLYFSKIKPEPVGKVNSVIDLMGFDIVRSRFFEYDPLYRNKRYFAGELAKEPKRENPLQTHIELPAKAKEAIEEEDEFVPPPF